MPAFAQEKDSIKTKHLAEVVVHGKSFEDIQHLPKITEVNVHAGIKNEVINVQNMSANIAEKTPRQIFAKVPGVFVYDMDGAGNQTNISTRGLDPHRGWEFNIRKNGIITNSDMYGYPASHYSLPMEAVERIEIVRGTGSLQYGAQFGGMLNYVTKSADTTRAVSFETINSIGSFNLLSTYNAIGGKLGKFQYYAYYSKRTSDGYRDVSHTDYDAQSFMLIYAPSKKFRVKAEVARSNYLYRIPGPLTDSMFTANPTLATRTRNYFSPEIYVPSLTFYAKPHPNVQLSATVSAVLGSRSSVQFDKSANIVDAIDPNTLQYAPRQVDIDNFNSYTAELRALVRYKLGSIENVLVGGVQVFDNDMHRRQLGKGTTGTDYTLARTTPGWGRDLRFKTNNIALFLENSFFLKPNLVITPGVRIESGESDMSGVINAYKIDDLPNTIGHHFPLFGVSVDYTFKNTTNLYGGWSQAYRPVVLKDIIPSSVYESTDKNLSDASGYTVDLGYRGKINGLKWDASVFSLQYNNRMGTLSDGTDANGNALAVRTNIGNSITNGVELFVEQGWSLGKETYCRIFTATAYMDAHYTDAIVRDGGKNVDVGGNQVESVPEWISRNGFSVSHRALNVSILYSYTAKSYADPKNTETPSATGSVGAVPSYGILDVNSTVRLANNLIFRVNFNNVLDKQYFTKRPSFYPGPGVGLPMDDR